MPKISRNFDDLTIGFEEAVKRTHPFISSAWNSDADVADFNLLLVNQEKNYAQEAELIKSYDVDESSAEYFSRFILHSAFPSYNALYDIDGDNITSGVDAESYMQCAALQLLHRDGRLNEAIEACKSCTLTPINCLLKNTKLPDNYDENQDAADIKRITEAMDKAFGNNPMLQSIGEIIKRHKAGQQHYLAVRTKSPEWEFFFP